MKVIDGTIASPLGFSADGLHAGFKKRKMDFGWIVSEKPASVADVYKRQNLSLSIQKISSN